MPDTRTPLPARLLATSAIALIGTGLAGATRAGDVPDTAPPPAPSEREAEKIEPEVRIIEREDKTIEEYRVNGRLYMIKVTPRNAPPYYLVDSDGDGSLETRQTEIEPDLMIPSWVLFRW